MSRPTKEEAKGWAALTAHHIENGSRPTEAELAELRNWLARVARVLPSAAAVQRDCERREKLHSSHPEGCSCGDPECPQYPFRPQ